MLVSVTFSGFLSWFIAFCLVAFSLVFAWAAVNHSLLLAFQSLHMCILHGAHSDLSSSCSSALAAWLPWYVGATEAHLGLPGA